MITNTTKYPACDYKTDTVVHFIKQCRAYSQIRANYLKTCHTNTDDIFNKHSLTRACWICSQDKKVPDRKKKTSQNVHRILVVLNRDVKNLFFKTPLQTFFIFIRFKGGGGGGGGGGVVVGIISWPKTLDEIFRPLRQMGYMPRPCLNIARKKLVFLIFVQKQSLWHSIESSWSLESSYTKND